MLNSDLDLVFEEYGDGSITHTKSYENSKKEGFWLNDVGDVVQEAIGKEKIIDWFCEGFLQNF